MFAFFVIMLEDLKLNKEYDGFIFLAESTRNPPALKPHHHHELELNLVASGEITYVTRGKRFRFSENSLLWFFPDQEHQLIDRTPDAEYYVAVFKPEMIKRACKTSKYDLYKQNELSKSGILHSMLNPDNFLHLRRTMEALIEDGPDPDLINAEAGFGLSDDFHFSHEDPDLLNAGLRHLLLLCAREQSKQKEGSQSQILHPAVQLALKELNKDDDETDLRALASRSNLSASYLSRLFHQQIGVPLNRYRNSVRLRCFWELYFDKKNKGLIDIVYEAGFGSYAQFYRIFKETYNKNPKKMLPRRKK